MNSPGASPNKPGTCGCMAISKPHVVHTPVGGELWGLITEALRKQ